MSRALPKGLARNVETGHFTATADGTEGPTPKGGGLILLSLKGKWTRAKRAAERVSNPSVSADGLASSPHRGAKTCPLSKGAGGAARSGRTLLMRPTPLGSPPPMGGGRSGPSLRRGGPMALKVPEGGHPPTSFRTPLGVRNLKERDSSSLRSYFACGS